MSCALNNTNIYVYTDSNARCRVSYNMRGGRHMENLSLRVFLPERLAETLRGGQSLERQKYTPKVFSALKMGRTDRPIKRFGVHQFAFF